MRVFVTGASGFIGSATVAELLEAGHEVLGLARSEESAAAIAEAGAEVHRGSLEDLDSLRAGAAQADGVIHTGFVHDFTNMAQSVKIDRAAIEAIGDEIAGSDRAFVIASGTALVGGGIVATEDLRADPDGHAGGRAGSEATALELASRGVRSVVVRFPSSVHGAGDGGFVPALVAAARERGVAGYIGDGSNRWAAVSRFDAARLLRLAVESAPAGSVLHGVGEEGIPTREIAEAIARGLGVETTSISADRATEDLGWIGGFFSADIPASSARTQELLGWEPTGPTLLEDLESTDYFEAGVAR